MNRSSVCEGGGKNPHWNDTFYLTVQGDPMMRVEVFDDDSGRDDLVGMGNYNLMQNMNQGMNTTSTYYLIQFGSISSTMDKTQVESASAYSSTNKVVWEVWA